MIGGQIKEFFRPWWVRICLPAVTFVATYDGVASQFELPNLKKVIGASGALLPVWGWLLVLQGIAIAALFDYVRRNIPVAAAPPESPTIPLARIEAIEAKLENVRVDGAVNNRDLEKLTAEAKRRDERILGSFHALYVREQLAVYEEAINSDVELLYKDLRNGDTYDLARWDSWDSVHSHWESMLIGWLHAAKWYVADLEKRVTHIDESEFRASQWSVSDTQFPNSEAVRLFKRHRLIHGKWETTRKIVNTNVRRVAFEAMTEPDVRLLTARDEA